MNEIINSSLTKEQKTMSTPQLTDRDTEKLQNEKLFQKKINTKRLTNTQKHKREFKELRNTLHRKQQC